MTQTAAMTEGDGQGPIARAGFLEGPLVHVASGVAVVPVFRWRESAGALEAEPIAVIVSRRSGVTRLAVPGAGSREWPRLPDGSVRADELAETTRLRLLEAAIGDDSVGPRDQGLRLQRVKMVVPVSHDFERAATAGTPVPSGEPAAPRQAPEAETEVACRVLAAGDSISIQGPGTG